MKLQCKQFVPLPCALLFNLIQIALPSFTPGNDIANSLEYKDSSPYTKLPGDLRPLNYKVWIRPVLENSKDFVVTTAPGVVNITIQAIKTTKQIVLHAKQLQIAFEEVKVTRADGGSEVKIVKQSTNPSEQTYTIEVKEQLEAGKIYNIYIPFTGSIYAKQTGLYGFVWPDFWEAGPPLVLAASSRFAPFYAREAFPCFDESQYRATFDVSIARLEKYRTLSNAKFRNSTPCQVPGWVWDHFERTLPMPVSSLSILVFAKYDKTIADASLFPGVKVIVWAPEKFIKRNGTVFAAHLSAKLLTWFEEYLGVPFPVAKLDSITMWHTYSGAIGHLGTITYNLAGGSIFYFAGNSPEWKRLSVALLVAQQIARQWVGNLVSPTDWSDCWMFEGLAEYLAHVALDAHHPEFKVSDTFFNLNNQLAFMLDQTLEPPPLPRVIIQNSVGLNEGKIGYFDENFLPKSAALIQMIAIAAGPSAFRHAVSTFVRQFVNKTASAKDFMAVLDQQLGSSFLVKPSQVLDSWSRNPGFPIVRAGKVNKTTLKLSQEPFSQLSNGEHRLWPIPVAIHTAGRKNPTENQLVWLHEKEQKFHFDTSQWAVLNTNANGYYRVLYDPGLREAIKAQLQKDHTVFSATTRSQLLDDYFAFAEFGHASWEEALELTAYLHKETELVVWETFFAHFDHALRMSSGNDALSGLKEYLVPKLEAALQILGLITNDIKSGAEALLQSELFRHACKLGSKLCSDFALVSVKQMQANATNNNSLALDLRPIVYCAAVAAGNQKLWEFIKKSHDTLRGSEEKSYLFDALTCSKDTAVLNTMIQDGWKLSGPHLALQTLEAMIENPTARPLVIESMKEHVERVGPADFGRLASRLAEFWVPGDTVEELENFVASKKEYFDFAKDEVALELRRMKENVRWAEKVGNQLETWCRKQAKG